MKVSLRRYLCERFGVSSTDAEDFFKVQEAVFIQGNCEGAASVAQDETGDLLERRRK